MAHSYPGSLAGVSRTRLAEEYSKYIYIVYEHVLIAVKQLMEVNPIWFV